VGLGLTCSMGASEERQSLREQSMRSRRGREKLSPGEGKSMTGGESACGMPTHGAPPPASCRRCPLSPLPPDTPGRCS